MTADQVKRVEIETRGQSTNDLWHQQRIGRVTASNFHTYHTKAQSILNRKGQNVKKPAYSSLVSSLLSKSGDGSHLPQIKWGTAHEKDAIKLLCQMLLPNVMVVYKVLRNADCSSNATTRPCCFTRWLVFVQILRPFNC